ncbi:hypothetical protein VZT92_015305 [Zoarces viviparus]|uniref:GMP reductase n=1 Tax=Zoarces viviparus TaxID=48416 RepID=A0AAW1EW37_ZOAVI
MAMGLLECVHCELRIAGSVRTARIKTGVGYPQLSAVIECADSAHGLKGHIISYGSFIRCSCPGDVAKAFGAGADFVIMGGDACGPRPVRRRVTTKHPHSYVLLSLEVPYRGDVENTILDVLGGLRSTCTYVGAAKLKELNRRTTFIRVTQQSNQMFTW